MLFSETSLRGAYLIDLEPIFDERGFFSRIWCANEFELMGLNNKLVQCNYSYNTKRGTIRGMHYQLPPHEEAKLVTCIAGAIYDVIIDLRKHSPTYCCWQALELSAANRRTIYVPAGFAHGFQTQEDDTTVFYQMSEYHHPECSSGIRWDDPTFHIRWPSDPIVISKRDATYRDFVL